MANEGEIVVEEKKEEKPVVVEPKVEETPEAKEIRLKEEKKQNLDKAIVEAEDTLRGLRKTIKDEKKPTEEEIPKIDDNDPGAKAWNKRITEAVAPATEQLEKQKGEVRTFVLREFLKDKPALAKNPEKLKELMGNYERIKSSTELTREGIQADLEKAYGATFSQELISAARNGRIDKAKEDMIMSDIAIDHGVTTETTEAPKKKVMSAEEKAIVAQWEQFGAPKID